MATSKLSKAASPKIPKDTSSAYLQSSPSSSSPSSSSMPKPIEQQTNTHQADTAAYENYVRLPELRKLWSSNDFPEWRNESVIRPSLQALETTFRFISTALSDPRPYINHREWKRRLESLTSHQIELIALFCEDEGGFSGAPVAELSSAAGVLTRERSSQVWKVSGTSNSFISRTSEASLLPRLASWEKSEDMAAKIGYLIESQFRSCPFTLGLCEPNLAGKPSLEYDLVVRPAELHALKRKSTNNNNYEELTLFAILQILESWLAVAAELLSRIEMRIDEQIWVEASNDCWILERIWKLLLDVEDLELLMDPDDVLRLKAELGIRGGGGSFCFRSPAMAEVTRRSKELRVKVPWIVGVEVDPSGGPRVQEAAMRLFHHHNGGRRRQVGDEVSEEEVKGRVAVMQALQAVEAAMKRFFFGYRQIVSVVMGSLEAGGNRAVYMQPAAEELDSLSEAFLEPPLFPSLDAAKTFLGNYWQCRHDDQEKR